MKNTKHAQLLFSTIFISMILSSIFILLIVLVSTTKYSIVWNLSGWAEIIRNFLRPSGLQDQVTNVDSFLYFCLLFIFFSAIASAVFPRSIFRTVFQSFLMLFCSIIVGFLWKVAGFFLKNPNEDRMNFYLLSLKKLFTFDEKLKLYKKTFLDYMETLISREDSFRTIKSKVLEKMENSWPKYTEINLTNESDIIIKATKDCLAEMKQAVKVHNFSIDTLEKEVASIGRPLIQEVSSGAGSNSSFWFWLIGGSVVAITIVYFLYGPDLFKMIKEITPGIKQQQEANIQDMRTNIVTENLQNGHNLNNLETIRIDEEIGSLVTKTNDLHDRMNIQNAIVDSNFLSVQNKIAKFSADSTNYVDTNFVHVTQYANEILNVKEQLKSITLALGLLTNCIIPTAFHTISVKYTGSPDTIGPDILQTTIDVVANKVSSNPDLTNGINFIKANNNFTRDAFASIFPIVNEVKTVHKSLKIKEPLTPEQIQQKKDDEINRRKIVRESWGKNNFFKKSSKKEE